MNFALLSKHEQDAILKYGWDWKERAALVFSPHVFENLNSDRDGSMPFVHVYGNRQTPELVVSTHSLCTGRVDIIQKAKAHNISVVIPGRQKDYEYLFYLTRQEVQRDLSVPPAKKDLYWRMLCLAHKRNAEITAHNPIMAARYYPTAKRL